MRRLKCFDLSVRQSVLVVCLLGFCCCFFFVTATPLKPLIKISETLQAFRTQCVKVHATKKFQFHEHTLNFDHILNIVMNSLLAQLFVNRCMEFSNSLQASRKQCVDMHIQCQYTPISLLFWNFLPLWT